MITKMASAVKEMRSRILGPGDPVKNTGCTEFEVDNLVLSRFVLRRLVPVVGYEPYPLNELMFMGAAMCRVRPTHLIEWGTNIGKSARIFAETNDEFGLGVELTDRLNDLFHLADRGGQQRG